MHVATIKIIIVYTPVSNSLICVHVIDLPAGMMSQPGGFNSVTAGLI